MREHKYTDIQYVRNNPNEFWSLYCLSHNKQLTVNDIENLKLSNSFGNWDWYSISIIMDINEVRNNPNKPWYKDGLSFNPGLTVKDIETLKLPNSNKNWQWYYISKCININEVINNPDKPWDRNGLEHNDGITDEIIEFFDAGLLKHLHRKIGKFNYHTDITLKCG